MRPQDVWIIKNASYGFSPRGLKHRARRMQSNLRELLKHQTLPLMGATRLETAEKTDAGRVAPISACVSSSTKYYHQTLSLMGGDASRVGAFSSTPVSRRANFLQPRHPVSLFANSNMSIMPVPITHCIFRSGVQTARAWRCACHIVWQSGGSGADNAGRLRIRSFAKMGVCGCSWLSPW